MKVVLLSSQDTEGGAGRAAYRLHRGLISEEISSQMLVNIKFSDDITVDAPTSPISRGLARLRPGVDRLPLKLYKGRSHSLFSCQWLPEQTLKRILEFTPDVVNAHWICDGFASIATLSRIHLPMVWTLHDMWMFTGGCHYTQDCTRYQQSCGACPQLASTHMRDLSHWIWQRKASAWGKLAPQIVTPSQWMADCVRSSSLLQAASISIIPNGIDLVLYRPIDAMLARKLLNLPLDKTLLCFGTVNPTQDLRKGFHLLQPALKALKTTLSWESIELVIIGASGTSTPIDLGFKTHYLGILKDDLTLTLAYSAADIFIAPSVQDNLPNTVLEAMACGTPCVAFNIGGMPDLIDHHLNGFLAEPFKIESLADGIAWVMSPDRLQQLSRQAREKVEKSFSLALQAKRYKDLFEEVIDAWKLMQGNKFT